MTRHPSLIRHRQRNRFATWVAAATIVLALAAVVPATAYPRPGRTEHVSVSSGGVAGNSTSWYASLSADGRYVAFNSQAWNLVPGDTNGKLDVFVHDRVRGTTERVSVGSDGAESAGESFAPTLSADGRLVAFYSDAANLVPGDTNGNWDVFVRDREARTTERVSIASSGVQANHDSFEPKISKDGSHVVFTSMASNLVPGDTNSNWEVFVHDRGAHTTERVSVSSAGAQGDALSRFPAITADGRFVAFHSTSSNLVAEDTNGQGDIFVRDRETNTTERVSLGAGGAQSDRGGSSNPAISDDGRFIAFDSQALNLVPGDTNGETDVFVRDRETGATTRVSVSSAGEQGNDLSEDPSISGDGRHVSFWSGASNLVPDDAIGEEAFVHDRGSRTTEWIAVSSDGVPADRPSGNGELSTDGRFAGFSSRAQNLVPGATSTQDVYVRDRGPDIGLGRLSVTPMGQGISASGWATFSGQTIAVASDPAADAVAGGSEAGAELTGARITYRPEPGDLLVELGLASIPSAGVLGTRTDAGAPGILYALTFELGGERFEVRALRAGVSANPPSAPYFALYRCEDTCTEAARLTGGLGTTGDEALVSIPLSALGAAEGASLSGIRAFTAAGEAGLGGIATLDEAAMPDATIPRARVWLGTAPAGTEGHDVAFDVEPALSGGRFATTLEPPAGGPHRLWGRACLGTVCGTTSVPL